jgi:hypothetical protein
MIILDTLLIGGFTFVLRRIAEAVDAQLEDADSLREDLLAAQMRLELGEITEAEFAAVERSVLDRLRELRRRDEEGAAGGGLRVTGVEAITVAGETVQVEAPGPPGGRSRRRRHAGSARPRAGAPPVSPM